MPMEVSMARMFMDCRDYPSEMNCTVAISADTKKELVDAAVQHAVPDSLVRLFPQRSPP